jgi:hypothetical protein
MKQRKRGRKPAETDAPAATEPADSIEPLSPRRGLFMVLMVALAVWVIVLVLMYFLTVDGVR